MSGPLPEDAGRSVWGWGFADRLGDEAQLRTFAAQVPALLGFDAQEPELPVPPEAWRLPPPRIDPPAELAAVAATDPRARALRSYGRAYPDLVRGLRGDFSAAPDLVLRPVREEQVEQAMAFCERVGAALVPYGGGTSVVAGVEADRDAHPAVVCLDLRGLRGVLEVDPVSRAARIQAGATGPVLNEGLRPHGLSLRHYPQSYEFSTLGGWIATRAGGHYAVGATHIDDLVESVRMLTPRGPWESRRLPGSGAGPSPDRLVLGSEGILGVVTEAWVRVQPRPTERSDGTAFFAEWRAAVDSVRAIVQSGLRPAGCRLLDAREAALNGVAFDGSCVLVLGFESAGAPVRPAFEAAAALVRAHGGRFPREPRHRSGGGDAPRTDAGADWRAAFLEAPYLRDRLVCAGVLVDTFETACTWDRFFGLHEAVIGAVRGALKTHCGGGRVSCRFTHVYPDGPAPYYTFLAPARRGAEQAQWAAVKQAASDAILAAGGTITHHHGVGRTHRSAYEAQRPQAFSVALRAAKAALDPAGVLNPGVLLAPSE